MGQSSSKNTFPQSRYYNVLDYKYCKVWKRKDNQKETMEQYEVCIQNQSDLTKYQKMWQIRTQQQNVVGVYYFNHHSTQEICSVLHNASILTERIPYRLSQFRNIPYSEILSIMRTCFKTFKILYTQYGLFKVKSTMLGINCQRQLKVWHHTDYSNPQPENSNCKSLLEMLRSIIHSIQLNADQPLQYVRFSEFLDVNKDRINANFDQILEVLQAYRQMNKLPFSQSLPQIKYYIRKAEGEDQQSFNTYFTPNLSRQAHFNQYSPQKEIVSSRGYSPIHINPSPPLQINTYNRVSPLNQSNKTIKRNPSINIYTHKDVNRILESQKELSHYLQLRQQRLNSPYQLQHTPPKVYRPPNQPLFQNFRPHLNLQPSMQRNQKIYMGSQPKFRPIIARQMNNRDYYRQERRDLNSIQRRLQDMQRNGSREIYYRLQRRQRRGDERRLNGADKTARFQISTIRSNSLNNSKSKQSSFIFL